MLVHQTEWLGDAMSDFTTAHQKGHDESTETETNDCDDYTEFPDGFPCFDHFGATISAEGER
ncbi:hypothetical protein LC1Hm_1722 [Halomicrobium sp. LC1Hm]|nr:hypothetical protein LC1Hm_1722 [Halomicrobium sp. LC1Hm]